MSAWSVAAKAPSSSILIRKLSISTALVASRPAPCSRIPKIALEEAANWPYPIKGYGSYDEMINAQKSAAPEEKLDYILIVTPNFVHFDPAMKAMDAGIPVFCEKPLTRDPGRSREAR